jgi:exodeoxyribonuclease VII small subunit
MAEITFEDAMKELEALVKRIESGEPTLDESIALFQRGVELSKLCAAKLDEIEKRIVQLVEAKDGGLVEAPFAQKEN